MVILDQLSSSLRDAVKRLWPEDQGPISVFPLSDLSLGDLGSDVALQLAEKLNQDPVGIAERILEILAAPKSVQVSTERGYINFRLNDPSHHLDEGRGDKLGSDPLRIVAAPFISGADARAVFRLHCAAICQLTIAKHLGAAVEFWIGEERVDVAGLRGAAGLGRALFGRIQAGPGTAPFEAVNAKKMLAARSAKVCLWLLPDSLGREQFKAVCDSDSGDCSRLRLLAPAAPWIKFTRTDDPFQSFSRLSDEEVLAMLWYVAQPLPALDLDSFVPCAAEKANPIWYWKSTVSRSTELLRALGDSRQPTVEDPSPLLREIAVRLSFLRAFWLRAAWEGSVQEFLSVLMGTLSAFNRISNTPTFRSRLERGELSEHEAKIIAGAPRILSDSITLCDFFKA